MSLPSVAPDVLADAVDALPGRLRKKLDETVAVAAGWPVAAGADGGVVVTVDEQTTVTLAAVVRVAGDATCTCLLSPRCLHRTAILAAAPVHGGDAHLAGSDTPAD
ncbi:hypothetical protein, partial [Luedemannella flava]|uniref:hypothetical protein n=1 Tax=Luedemannella flava TaxID=349316 RepID=UPI0031DDA4F7